MGKQRLLRRLYNTSGRGIIGVSPEYQTSSALTVKGKFIELCLFYPDPYKISLVTCQPTSELVSSIGLLQVLFEVLV